MKNKFYLIYILFITSFLLSQSVLIDEKFKNLLFPTDLSYIGHETIIYWSSDGKSSSAIRTRVYHQSNKMRVEYQAPENMKDIILIDNGEYIFNYNKITKTALKMGKSLSLYSTDKYEMRRIKSNYIFNPFDKKIFNGRQAWVMMINPRDNVSPSREVTIDEENNIIVQTKIFLFSNQLVQNSYFSDITYDAKISSYLFDLDRDAVIIENEGHAENFLNLKSLLDRPLLKVYIPSYIPIGYSFEKAILTQEQGLNILQMIFNDGLNSISIFETFPENIKKIKASTSDDNEVKNVKDVPIGLSYKIINNREFYAVGTLPSYELNKIIESINVKKENESAAAE